MSEKLACAYCGGGVEQPSGGVGRPSSYCSAGCRRAAQSERQRITRHLERLEAETLDLRHAVRRGGGLHVAVAAGFQSPAERLEDVERDVAELRGRLRELLDE